MLLDHCRTTLVRISSQLLTRQYVLIVCPLARDEYTSDRKYYKDFLRLTAIPTNIPKDAVQVYLRHNMVSNIKVNAFSGLSECTLLDLQNNLISEVEPGAFNGLGNLTDLDLSYNRLSTLKIGMLQGLVAVEYLSFHFNLVSSIEDNTFANLMRLKELNLAVNRLESLSPGVFCGLESIEIMNLAGNPLTSLPRDVFKHLPRPLSLQLYGNRLECDTALCWLKQEELNGTIGLFDSQTRCGKEVNWDTWSCSETGHIYLAFTFINRSLFVHIFSPVLLTRSSPSNWIS